MSLIPYVYDFNLCARGHAPRWQPNWFLVAQATAHCAEELTELKEALHLAGYCPVEAKRGVYAEIVDGALDLAYVAVNVLWAMGVPREVAETALKRIQQANMAKMPPCPSCMGAGRVEGHDHGTGEMLDMDCAICQGWGLAPPDRNEHGKILKPEGWKAPDIVGLIPEDLP